MRMMAHGGDREMDGDLTQGGDANGQHILRGAEHLQQDVGDGLEQEHAHQHEAHGVADAQLDGLDDPGFLPCTVVVGDDGHQGVVHAEDGHEEKGLQFEIRAEDRHGGGGEIDQDQVHAKGHDAADGRT